MLIPFPTVTTVPRYFLSRAAVARCIKSGGPVGSRTLILRLTSDLIAVESNSQAQVNGDVSSLRCNGGLVTTIELSFSKEHSTPM